jgi:hypothetical protein
MARKCELLGSVWIDGACIAVGDPCALFGDRGELTEKFLNESPEGGVLDLEKDRGFVVTTGVEFPSDGFYRVYLERDDDGYPLKVIVDLRLRTTGSLAEGNYHSVR